MKPDNKYADKKSTPPKERHRRIFAPDQAVTPLDLKVKFYTLSSKTNTLARK